MVIPAFIETPRFPDDIAAGSTGGPRFKTQIFEGQSGIEQRNKNWSKPRLEWTVNKGIRDRADMETMRDWFRIVSGRGTGFRFKDWRDYSMTLNVIGTGDAIETVFPIYKTYTVGAYSVTRRLFKIVDATYSVYVNAVLQTEGGGVSQYSIDIDTGIITFGSSIVPPDTEEITVTCEFDVPCRFDVDHMSTGEEGYENETWSSIGIKELILE